MSKRSNTTSKLVTIYKQLGWAKSRVPEESNARNNLELRDPSDPDIFGDFGHLKARRRWSRTPVDKEAGFDEGMPLCNRMRSDLQICGLSCYYDTLALPQQPTSNTQSLSQDSSPVTLIAPSGNIEDMADRKGSNRRHEKPKKATGNAVTRFIRRLSPTKRYNNDSSAGASSCSRMPQGASSSQAMSAKDDASSAKCSSYKTAEKPTKASLNQISESNSSSRGSLSIPSAWVTPAPSYTSINQDEHATELKLLSQLHSTFDEATNILGNYISVRNRKN